MEEGASRAALAAGGNRSLECCLGSWLQRTADQSCLRLIEPSRESAPFLADRHVRDGVATERNQLHNLVGIDVTFSKRFLRNDPSQKSFPDHHRKTLCC